MPATFALLEKKKTELLRKALGGSTFLADVTEPSIEVITDASGLLLPLPAGTGPGAWGDVGLLTDAGMGFTRDVTNEETTSFGRVSPTRTDITGDNTTFTIQCQETSAKTIALGTGADLTLTTPLAGGEVIIRKPTRPRAKFYRALAMAVDENEFGEIYIGRSFPRCKVTSFEAQNFTKGADPILWGVTFQGYEDSDLGYSEAWHYGGPGWTAILLDMGFPAAGAATVAEITSASPLTGPIAGGQFVTIRGYGFTGTTGVTGVKFGTVNASSYTVQSDIEIVAITPATTAGPKTIIVTNAVGPSTTGPDFTFA